MTSILSLPHPNHPSSYWIPHLPVLLTPIIHLSKPAPHHIFHFTLISLYFPLHLFKTNHRSSRKAIIDNSNSMSQKTALWRHIGKQQSGSSSGSSLSQTSKIKKAFHITFQPDVLSSNNTSWDNFKKMKINSSISEIDRINEEDERYYDRHGEHAMEITIDDLVKDRESEEAIDRISFDSKDSPQMKNLHHILSQAENEPKPVSLEIACNQKQNEPPLTLLPNQLPKPHQFARSRLLALAGSMVELKKQLHNYKEYLLNILSEWELNAINKCKQINVQIDAYVDKMEGIHRKERESGFKTSNEFCTQNAQLTHQITELREKLSSQQERREILEEKLKLTERKVLEQSYRQPSEDRYSDNMRDWSAKCKRLQSEIIQHRLLSENLGSKNSKLKEVISEKELAIVRHKDQVKDLQIRIKELKNKAQDSEGKQNKLAMEIKLLRQNFEQQRLYLNGQLQKSKFDCGKLRDLLKNSDQQLQHCEIHMSSMTKKLKGLDDEKKSLQAKIKDMEMQYYKRLQDFDKSLLDLENSVKEQHMNQQHRMEKFIIRDMQLAKIHEEIMSREIELNRREGQIQQMKEMCQTRMIQLQKQQEGMIAEYKLAINMQNASKERFYERYYTMVSPERERRAQSPTYTRPAQTHRSPYTSQRSLLRDAEIPTRDLREHKSPQINSLFRAKSQKNLSIKSYQRQKDIPALSFRRMGEQKKQSAQNSYREMSKLTSRINSLREELTKQLGHLGY